MGNKVKDSELSNVIANWIENYAIENGEINRKQIVEAWGVSGQHASALLQFSIERGLKLQYCLKEKKYFYAGRVKKFKIPDEIQKYL